MEYLSAALPDHLFTNITGSDRKGLAMLENIKSLQRKASQCYAENRTEAQWTQLIEKVLKGHTEVLSNEGGPSPNKIRVDVVTCDPLCEDLQPKENNMDSFSTVTAKVDIMLQFEFFSNHSLLKTFSDRDEAISIFVGKSWNSAIAFLPVEVKALSGTMLQGGLQATVASVACLTRLKTLALKYNIIKVEEVPEKIPPTPSFVIMGHMWYLFWSFWVGPEEIVQFGPYSVGDTVNIAKTFRLLAVIDELKRWGLSDHFYQRRSHVNDTDGGKIQGYWGMAGHIIKEAAKRLEQGVIDQNELAE